MDKQIIVTSAQELSEIVRQSICQALKDYAPLGTSAPQPEYLTIAEAATYLNLAKQTVYGFTSQRTIPFIKRAKRLLFLKSDLDAWLAEGKKQSRAQIKVSLNNQRSNG